MKTAALTYTIGFFEGKKLSFKYSDVMKHDRKDNRLSLLLEDGSLVSVNIDKYEYKLYADYKAAKEIKSTLLAQAREEFLAKQMPEAPIEETPQNASGI